MKYVSAIALFVISQYATADVYLAYQDMPKSDKLVRFIGYQSVLLGARRKHPGYSAGFYHELFVALPYPEDKLSNYQIPKVHYGIGLEASQRIRGNHFWAASVGWGGDYFSSKEFTELTKQEMTLLSLGIVSKVGWLWMPEIIGERDSQWLPELKLSSGFIWWSHAYNESFGIYISIGQGI